MRKQSRTALSILCTALLCACTINAAVLIPVGQDEHDFLYDRLERVRAIEPDFFDYQVGPYCKDLPDSLVFPFTELNNTAGSHAALLGFAAADIRGAKDRQSTSYESLRGAMAGRPTDWLHVYVSAMLDEELYRDPNYTGKKWRGFAGDVEQAFVHVRTGAFDASFGRFAAFWDTRRSLVIGPAQKLDGLAASYRWGQLSLSYQLARLDRMNPDELDVENFVNRYFAAHRIDLDLKKNLRVGVFETVVFGGPGRQIELFYLNPLLFFHGAQLNEEFNDNTAVGFDFSFNPASGYRLYGELLIDDVQLDKQTQGDQEPDQLALMVGCYAADIVPSFDARLEYSRVNNRVYNQMYEHNRYLYHHQPISSARGNDYELADLQLRRWFGGDLYTWATLSYYRQGEGTIEDPLTTPWTEVEGDYSEPFPTGVVEQTITAKLGVKGFLTNFIFVDAGGGVDRVTNRFHVQGEDETIPFFNIVLSVFYSVPVNLD